MPDAWETSQGLDPSDPADGNQLAPSETQRACPPAPGCQATPLLGNGFETEIRLTTSNHDVRLEWQRP